MEKNLILPRRIWRAMRCHVARRLPLEACGLLGGKNGRAEMSLGIRNAEGSPVRFRMEPRAQWRAFQRIESAGLELVAIYHSHPNGPDHPSPTDIAEAMYPVVQIIWFHWQGRWQTHGFWIESGEVIEVTLEIINSE